MYITDEQIDELLARLDDTVDSLESGLNQSDETRKIVRDWISQTDTEIIKCEVCGAKATSFVRDAVYLNNRLTGVMEYEPKGDIHCFCKDHVRDSQLSYGGDIM